MPKPLLMPKPLMPKPKLMQKPLLMPKPLLMLKPFLMPKPLKPKPKLQSMPRNKKLNWELVLDRYSCSQLKMTPSATTERTILSRKKTSSILSLSTPHRTHCRTTKDGTLMMQTRFAQMAFL
jgi:hypothetical protein